MHKKIIQCFTVTQYEKLDHHKVSVINVAYNMLQQHVLEIFRNRS